MWSFGQIDNKSSNQLLVDYAVPGSSSIKGADLNATRGNAILVLDTVGGIFLTDAGNVPGGPAPLALDIQYTNVGARWFYDGELVVDVIMNDDGSFVLTGVGKNLEVRGNLSTQSDLAMAAAAPDLPGSGS